jgi:hypothetical protein
LREFGFDVIKAVFVFDQARRMEKQRVAGAMYLCDFNRDGDDQTDGLLEIEWLPARLKLREASAE